MGLLLARSSKNMAGVMKKMWIGAGIAVIVLLLAALLAALWHFSDKVIHIKVWGQERIEQFEVNSGVLKLEYLAALPKEEVSIPSPYGYELKGWFIPRQEPSSKTVILVHGVTRSRLTSIKYVELFRKRGFHVLVYDQRRHGQSGGGTTTYGYYEKYDLKACVDWVLERTGAGSAVGIHGESMGAATALQHAAIDNRASFYIADCPYSNITEQLIYRLKVEYGLPAYPLIPLVALICRLRARFRLHDAASLLSLQSVETPILFVHGENDTYIEKQMTEAMYSIKSGRKQLYLAPNADHAEAYMKNPDEYDRVVGDFLQEIGIAIDDAQSIPTEG
ncbi:MAG: alpha/beta hydrolase family [Paenibacillaceae bacterium]|jgi:fermentation-respiration switch protein FrsA (DUF1100 family)|nr:alpha/beta hydrolase family [Paenibacillaceae bacterium]